MEFDHVLKIVGEFGPHQKRLYFLLCLSIVPAAIQLLLLVFIAAEPTWVCVGSSANNTCPKNRSHCAERHYTSKFTSIISEVIKTNQFHIKISWTDLELNNNELVKKP